MLLQKLQHDLNAALKKQDKETVSTLRLLLAEIYNRKIAKKTSLSDQEIMQIIRSEIKKLSDAAEQFKKGGRDDLVTANKSQITILSIYLPEEISDKELESEIGRLISENKELYDKNPKALIGIVIRELNQKASPRKIVDYLEKLESS